MIRGQIRVDETLKPIFSALTGIEEISIDTDEKEIAANDGMTYKCRFNQ